MKKFKSLPSAVFSAILLLAAVSCTHKKEGWIVKGQDGKLYRLEGRVANEAYELREIDSVAVNRLMK